jgi:hypothetical protein
METGGARYVQRYEGLDAVMCRDFQIERRSRSVILSLVSQTLQPSALSVSQLGAIVVIVMAAIHYKRARQGIGSSCWSAVKNERTKAAYRIFYGDRQLSQRYTGPDATPSRSGFVMMADGRWNKSQSSPGRPPRATSMRNVLSVRLLVVYI